MSSEPSFANRAIHLGTCCAPVDADWPTGVIAWFGHVPTLLFVANFALGFANHEIYFTVTSNLFLLCILNALWLISEALGVRRPAGFDAEQCRAPPYAFPDPIYVATLSFVLASLLAVALDRQLRTGAGRLAPTVIIGALVGYAMSTLVTHYFDLYLLVCNTVLAACLAAIHVAIYSTAALCFGRLATRRVRRRAHFLLAFLDKRALALQNDTELFET